MTFRATIYRVLIASPADTVSSRDAVNRAIADWNDLNAEGYEVVLLPLMWEISSTPAVGASPQTILNDQMVNDADIVVALFWTRLGTPTDNAISGTVEEIEHKSNQGAQVMIYFSAQPAVMATVDGAQIDALKAFRAAMQGKALLGSYDSDDDLFHKVQRDLTRAIRKLHTQGAGGADGGSGSPVDPLGGDQDDGSGAEQELERIFDSYKGELRGLLARQQIEFEGAVPANDSDSMRRSMSTFGRGLSQVIAAVASVSPEAADSALMARLRRLTQRAAEVGRMHMFLDGGLSWNSLLTESGAVFEGASELLKENWVRLSHGPPAGPEEEPQPAGS